MSTPQLAPLSQVEPADAPEQVVYPSVQGMSSAVVPQEPTTDETTEELPSVLAPINPAAEDIPSAGTTDHSHGTLQIASSSQRQESALKQVSRLT